MNVVKLHKYPCSFCKKNAATQFCDFVIGYSWTSAKNEKGHMIGSYHLTCDNEICKECATSHAGFDFCPSCEKLHEMVQKKHDHRRGNMMIDIAMGRYEDIQ